MVQKNKKKHLWKYKCDWSPSLSFHSLDGYSSKGVWYLVYWLPSDVGALYYMVMQLDNSHLFF